MDARETRETREGWMRCKSTKQGTSQRYAQKKTVEPCWVRKEDMDGGPCQKARQNEGLSKEREITRRLSWTGFYGEPHPNLSFSLTLTHTH